MIIRHASVDDAKKIIKITDQSRMTAGSREGLVDYPALSERDYAFRISDNQFFYVAVRDDVIGFLAAYDDLDIARLSDDEIAVYIAKKPAPFVYLDVIAVEPEMRRHGIASAMLQQLLSDTKEKGYPMIWGAVAHVPESKAGKNE